MKVGANRRISGRVARVECNFTALYHSDDVHMSSMTSRVLWASAIGQRAHMHSTRASDIATGSVRCSGVARESSAMRTTQVRSGRLLHACVFNLWL